MDHLEKGAILGTVHFLRGRGHWWDLGWGVTPKKTAEKGGHPKKKRREVVGGGGVTPNILVHVELT